MNNHWKLNEKLWMDTLKVSAASLYHPFVLKIAQGTLDTHKFQSYMSQDDYFLGVMDECLRIMETKCSETDSESKELINKMKSNNSSELELHDGVLKMAKPRLALNSAAKDYTENFKDVGSAEEGPGYLAASVTPCPALYQYIGEKISLGSPYKSDPKFNNDLRKWIEMYSSPLSAKSSQISEDLLNRLGSGLSYQKMLHYYRQSMVLEYMFFDAYDVTRDTCPPLCERFSSKKIVLLLDFDKTLTVCDTTDMVGKTAAKLNYGETKRWDLVSERYFAGYNVVKEKLNTANSIQEYCKILNDYENESRNIVSKEGILSGLTSSHFYSLSQCVQLRAGAKEILEKSFNKHNLEIKILSSNWSPTLIKATLGIDNYKDLKNFEIISNNLSLDCNSCTTGEICGSVCGPVDKEKQVNSLKNPDKVTVYVGDSVLDILALMAADIGIFVGDDTQVFDVCKKYNISILPLVSYMIDPECQQKQKSKVIFKADSLFEVIAFIHGIFQDDLVFSKCSKNTTPKVLTIGGSDSGGCSGIQADLKTFEAHGIFGMTSITSVTAQNTIGVIEINNIDSFSLQKQISCVLNDMNADVVKTGMLPTPESVFIVAKAVSDYGVRNLVVDPVIKSSTGTSISSKETVKALVTRLLPFTSIVTPNVDEASVLLNGKVIESVEDMKEAAREIHLLGPEWVLIKGGHLKYLHGFVSDILYDGINDKFHHFTNPFILTKNNRGTGCTFASAIAANLAKKMSMIDAVYGANEYVHQLLYHSTEIEVGEGTYGPMMHSFKAPLRTEYLKQKLEFALGLYLVTDDLMIEEKGLEIEKAVEEAILGGTSFVQIRCKNISAGEFCSKVKRALIVCKKHNVPLVVNDRIDVAMACNADGVHIGQSDVKLKDARRLLGPTKIIGVSATTLAEAKEAEMNGADYIGVGTVFSTATKTDICGLIGLDGLRNIVNSISIPTVAIGGINRSNAVDVMRCEVSGIAVVSAILKAESIEFGARKLRSLVNLTRGKKILQNKTSPINKINIKSQIIESFKCSVVIDDSVQDVKQMDIDETCKKIASYGFSAIQLKCRYLDGNAFAELGKRFTSKCKSLGISISINDRLDIAIASEAEGMHLEGNSMSIEDAIRFTGNNRIIGASVSRSVEAAKAESLGVDYVMFDIRSSYSLETLSEVCKVVNIPVFVTGKIDSKNISQLQSVGVNGVAVPLAFLDDDESILQNIKYLKNNLQ